MSSWDEHIARYPTKLILTQAEKDHLSAICDESFAANVDGRHILFARWGTDSLYSQGVGRSWRSLDDDSIFYPEIIRKGFPNEEFLERIDIYKGTGTYQRKEIKWDKNRFQWSYLSRSDHRVGSRSFWGFKPIVRVGFYRLPERRVIRGWRGLKGKEDPRDRSEHLSRLEDEGSPG